MGRWVVRSVNGGILVLCCFLTASIFNRISAEVLATPAVSAPPATRTGSVPQRSWQERRVIVDRNLFGAALDAGTPLEIEPEEEDLAATKLPLRLLGTAAAAEPALSTAAVEDLNTREHQVVRVNDRLENFSQAQVVRIDPRRIVLQNGARREELLLDDTTQAAAPRTRARATPRRAARSAGRRDRLGDRLRRLSENRFAVDREQAAEVGRNPAVLLQDGRPIPKYENGAMVGFQLTNVKPGGIFDRFGLANGEIITEVNGITIDSPTATTQIMGEFANAEEWSVLVRNADGGERPVTITLD